MNYPEFNQADPPTDPNPASNEQDPEDIERPGMTSQTNDPNRTVEPSQSGGNREEQVIEMPATHTVAEKPVPERQRTSTQSTIQIPETWLSKAQVDDMRTRWNAIQFQFVDSPCTAVEQGDTLVAEAIEHITQTLSDIQNKLNQQWLNYDDISTEELRYTLQNYRTVLDRLLSL